MIDLDFESHERLGSFIHKSLQYIKCKLAKKCKIYECNHLFSVILLKYFEVIKVLAQRKNI